MASDRDLLDRLDADVPARRFDVPTERVVGEARRRRRLQRGLVAAGVVALVAVAMAGPASRRGTTVAGFTVFESQGRAFIGVVVPSASMSPTLEPGDIAAVDLEAFVGSDPRRGDVIAFRPATVETACGGIFLKRIAGIAGDTVEQVDGEVLVNGRALEGPSPDRRTGDLGPWVVEPGHLFVVGDHLAISNDSRSGMGQISVTDVIGRVDPSVELERADIPAPPACSASVPVSGA